MNNQDLFRTSLNGLPPKSIVSALHWLHADGQQPYPLSIHLNLTLRCSAKCLHCQQWRWPKHKEYSLRQLDQLFNTFQTWKVQTITFGGGNPLLHPNFSAALKMADERGFEIGIITEGAEISDRLVDDICQYANWIRFSLDGSQAELHDKIRNQLGSFDLVINNVLRLKMHQSALPVGLNCVVQKLNFNCLQRIIDLGHRLEVNMVLFKLAHGNDPDRHYLLSDIEWKKFKKWVHCTSVLDTGDLKTNLIQLDTLMSNVFMYHDALKGYPVKNYYKQEGIHCYVPLFFLTCDSEGNAFPCDYLQADTRNWGGKYKDMRDRFGLGSILKNSEEVLENRNKIFRERIHNMPAEGFDECGCCTRFCQLNASLTQLDHSSMDAEMNKQRVKNILKHHYTNKDESIFL
ncbi:MAG: radical SAM protein [Deltaproteobacteria bacterium]|nr:radical SAM protein [Deltaproteobacteria bacterium]